MTKILPLHFLFFIRSLQDAENRLLRESIRQPPNTEITEEYDKWLRNLMQVVIEECKKLEMKEWVDEPINRISKVLVRINGHFRDAVGRSFTAVLYDVKALRESIEHTMLIDGLNKALETLKQGTGTSEKKKQTLVFFSHAVAQFSNFKDAWRNNISHGNEIADNRKHYLKGETTDIMNNARYFMVHLAQRLKE